MEEAKKYLAFSLHVIWFLGVCLFLVGCGGGGEVDVYPGVKTHSPKRATSRSYVINGVRYYPQQHYEYREIGIASYYGGRDKFHGKKTATAEIFNTHALTAAHKTLPLPSVVLVTNLENGRSLRLKVNDRGPFIEGRIIDVSQKASQLLGFYNQGTAKVQVECLVMESLALNQNPRGEIPLQLANAGSESLYGGVRKPQPAMPRRNWKGKPFEKQSSPILIAQASLKPRPTPQPLLKPAPRFLPSKVQDRPLPRGSSTNRPAFMAFAQAPPTSAVKKAAQKSGNIFIQAGTFSLFTNAQNLSTQLKTLTPGVPIDLKAILVRNASMFAVRLGPFRNSEEAKVLLKQMAQAGHNDARLIYN